MTWFYAGFPHLKITQLYRIPSRATYSNGRVLNKHPTKNYEHPPPIYIIFHTLDALMGHSLVVLGGSRGATVHERPQHKPLTYVSTGG